MSEQAAWEKANNDYLAAALNWLRLVLTQAVELLQPQEELALPQSKQGYRSRRRNEPQADAKPATSASSIDEEVAQAAAAMQHMAASDPSPALVILSRQLGLGAFEEQTLLLCAAMELDGRISPLCARAQGNSSRSYPTFALAMSLFESPAWDALSPERPLRYWRLIEINQPGAQPLTTSALRADERIVNFIKGLNYLDDRLANLFSPLPDPGCALPPSQQRQVDTIVRHLRGPARGTLPIQVQLLGSDAASKQAVAWHAVRELGLMPYRLAAEWVPTAWGELENLARLWSRESLLLPLALYLDAHDSSKDLPALGRFLSRIAGVVFLDTREPWPSLEQSALMLDVAKPLQSEQANAWREALQDADDATPALLAGQFDLSLPAIQRIALSITLDQDQPLPDAVWSACLMASRPSMDTLAQRLETGSQTWDDLVLPDAEKALLRQIMDQVGQRHIVYDQWGFRHKMNRGLGISALFAGESGTGKTLAAEVMARELRLNLYRIDLSQVVSKYIGETEKNLRKLFDAAEDGGSILFFDEADALFGKRSEVKDSHDRYANIEINYLLQRMEAYRGLAILATNMKSALDPAFMRRLRFIVNFPFPGIPERKRIWERAFPPETEREELDYDRLARFNLTGGSIHNIALNAAFLAASSGESRVTMPLIFEAVRNEFRKLDKPANEAEFRMIRSVETRP